MKTIFLASFILFYSCCFGQSVIHWEPEISVADGAIYGNTRPRIALTASNVPIVIFGKISSGKLFISRYNGTTFNTPIDILPATMDSYLSTWTGPDIAAKGDTVIAVFKANSMELGKVYSVRSVDGGLTFSDTIRVDNHDTGIAWMPSLDIDENGNPSVVYMAHDASWMNPRYNVVHSNDRGLSYQPEMEIALSIPNEACDCCPAEYVIDGAQHALLFRNNENNLRDIYAVYSNDDGLTYPEYINVDNLNWSFNACPSTGPDGMFNNGKLISTYTSRASGAYRIYLSETATSPALAFETRTAITPPTNSNGIQNYPRIKGKNDTIIMVWQESETSNIELFSAFTTTGSVSEINNSKALLNDSTAGAQTNSDIIYANGKIHVVFQDAATGDVIYKTGTIGTLSIVEKEKNQFDFYPNPNKDGIFYFNTPLNNLENISVKNTIGEICDFNVSIQGSRTLLKLDNANKGLYFLTYTNEELSNTVKLIIE